MTDAQQYLIGIAAFVVIAGFWEWFTGDHPFISRLFDRVHYWILDLRFPERRKY